jgi:hypothetical protein
MGPEIPIHGEGAKGAAEAGIVARVDNKVHHPSLEMLGGEDQDLLECLLADVVVEHPASLAFA